MTNTSKSTRILAYDMIRIAAIFAVVMIHSSSAYISSPVHTLDFFLGDIMESLSRIGVPLLEEYIEDFNTDSEIYGGSGQVMTDKLVAEEIPCNNQPYSIKVKVPPMAAIILKVNNKSK